LILRALFFQNNEKLGERGILGQPPRAALYPQLNAGHFTPCRIYLRHGNTKQDQTDTY